MTCLRLVLFGGAITLLVVALPVQAYPSGSTSDHMWQQLITDATRLNLPVRFLKAIPPDFIQFEFDDLRTYAAEYHPADHRLVLNRPLSFNAAGVVLKPLKKMTHKELEVLYHELFHAYMDFLSTVHGQESLNAGGFSLVDFARRQQSCRYGEVAITPVVQKKSETEKRYLTESESWEALNETWAVFIGWAIWNQLEIQKKGGGSLHQETRLAEQWLGRFPKAVQKEEFRGYYVPQDPDEQRVAHKRFLAGESQISGAETVMLMTEVLGLPDRLVTKLKSSPGLSFFFKNDPSCSASAKE